MSIPSKQIGQSNEYNLLWEICKELEKLIKIAGNKISTTTTTTTLP